MNKLESISTRLQSKEIEILKKYVERSRSGNVQHFEWEKINEDLNLDYATLKALAALGYIQLEMEPQSRGTVNDSYYLTLYPSALQRVEFEEYSPIKKWAVKSFLNYRDWIAIVGFVISVVLAILKIIEFAGQK